MDTLEKVLPRTIFLTVAGSHLYGTNIEGSDYDFKGVCIPTHDYFLGWLKSFEQFDRLVSKGQPHDLSIMALAKFAKLAAECNPSVVELLFATEADIIHVDEWGRELLAVRERFLSKAARFRFAGYAHSQLNRIKKHRAWLLNPPKGRPTRAMFDLGETTKVSKSELGAFEALQRDGADVELPKDVLALFLRERAYQSALTQWKQYEEWKATRNPARAALEAKHGFDCKHAMHLVRLMRMCREILRDGVVNVKRHDREELLAIRRGDWSYERLVAYAEKLDAECGELYERSSLPREPDRVWLDAFVVDLTDRYLRSAAKTPSVHDVDPVGTWPRPDIEARLCEGIHKGGIVCGGLAR